ncbi:MAG: galactokinase [Novosphingobium sp.]
MSLIERTRAGYVAAYGTEPEGVAFAPGRVNLIGEHVDYNDGLVLPLPISTGTAVAWGREAGEFLDAVALDFGSGRDRYALGAAPPHHPADWRSYLRGMAEAMARRGVACAGVKLAIAGSNPRGAGLSSSASLCIALGRALADAAGAKPDPRELALAAQSAEHNWAGVNCGIMDQMAIAAGKPGHALLLDCRSLATRHVALPDDWAIAIIQSGVTRGLVDGHYNARRRDCEIAAETLDLASLREASADLIEAADLDERIRNRARHVVTEIARTEAAVAAIDAGDLVSLGKLLRASHASLRDQFEVSVPEVDHLVDCANALIGEAGGARMTGGGFGGAVVAVLQAQALPDFLANLIETFVAPEGPPLNYLIERTGAVCAGADQ